jgi:IclR family mhp operon transcriptional activator
VAASLGLTFFSSTLTPAQAIERFLPELQELASRIGERVRELQAG